MTWQSSLQLHFDSAAHTAKTRLYHRAHTGALVVQRPLYPEPDQQAGICHIYVLYPPAGIADDDRLTLDFKLQSNSHAVITTPGAGKWYGQRESRRPITSSDSSAATDLSQEVNDNISAEQHIDAHIDDDAILEWLPQESIYYDHSVSTANNRFYLAKTASLITWDIAVFGRQAYQETFANGHYTNHLEVRRDGELLVSDHTSQPANSRWFVSPLGLDNQHIHGTLWAIPSADVIDPDLQNNPLQLGQFLDKTLTEIRSVVDSQKLPIQCTHNYQGINCRYLGTDVRACFEAFYQVRELIRERWFKIEPHRPRIWDT
ncbi:urease accessory protein UreD [Psychrobacter sp.]|uniref:urease accessory protein UreD n=1 Tax=Psychrobacter sp. TaxID=56811 RepID=UPI002649C0CC|nr:urease accessory protein UreD [Psychrobacter sp.]MDN6275486.1 urease accessory protein UreD [Psychrobacter sp.]MDN6307645.1 urease accessory protein UreD [Psychrobacter sp.]